MRLVPLISVALAALLCGPSLHAQSEAGWIRHAAISPDGEAIAFTYKGDLYRVPSVGGDAVQLTTHAAHDMMPVWSRDGATIAFASDRYGNFDVYAMPSGGGPATRLTFHSSDEHPQAFTPDGRHVVFGGARMDIAENRHYPTPSQGELYRVPVAGGRVDQVVTLPVEAASFDVSGTRMLYHDNKGFENEWRKHHRSSIARDLWLFETESGRHSQLTTFAGEDRNPVFSTDGAHAYFLSEEGGTFNVHRLSLADPTRRTQVTDFKTHPVRFLSIGGGTLAFTHHGDLYTMTEGGTPQQVTVRVRSQSAVNADNRIRVNGGIQEMAVSPDGKEIAFIARGDVWVTNTEGTLTKRITRTAETERHITFTSDGKGVVYASQRGGGWRILKTERVRAEEPFFHGSTLLRESVVVDGPGDLTQPQFSPDGKSLAFVADRNNLRVRDLASGRTRDLLTGADLLIYEQNYSWSPDSRWLLVDWRRRLSESEVVLVAADGSRRVNLTESGYDDGQAVFADGGKRVLWFTNRDGLRSYATSGRTERDVYAVFLNQQAWDAFNLSEADLKLKKAVEEALKPAGEAKKDEPAATAPLRIDFDGVTERHARLTIHSSQVADAVLSKDGEKLYYLTRFDGPYNLWETVIRTRETKQLVRLNTGAGQLTWDAKMENLYLLSNGGISRIDLAGASSKGISIAGEIEFDAAAERAHLFEHVVNRTRGIFYEPTFHGVDWTAMAAAYRPKVAEVGNSNEFAELLSELLGELNVSHSGARYSTSMDNADATASLGIFFDYAHAGNGIKITEVIRGGPLDKAGFDVKPGMVIQMIDGEAVTPDRDWAAMLNRKAGTFVLLELTGPGRNDRMQLVVKPITLSEERQLLYRRFVRINEAEVTAKSGGRLGYVHIPGMNDGAYRSVLHDMLGKFDNREAVIVDGRFNGGGDLVADLVTFFGGTQFSVYGTHWRDVDREPTSRWVKPTLSIYNESMYSDGHCYAAAYSGLNIGTTVGMPVPGTCSFAAWEMLPDRTRWGVVPISARNVADEWMENNPTKPDHLVKNMPGVIDRGTDQQLEKAIQVMLQELDSKE
jgi:Tol biopolymer transport system component/C-terminal processing protease CtpA/Prc